MESIGREKRGIYKFKLRLALKQLLLGLPLSKSHGRDVFKDMNGCAVVEQEHYAKKS